MCQLLLIVLVLCFKFVFNHGFLNFGKSHEVITAEKAQEYRKECYKLLDEGRNLDLIKYLEDLEKQYGTLKLDEIMPSLYNHLGVAYHNANDVKKAEKAFLKGVQTFPNDVRTWINLGETRVHIFNLKGAIEAFRVAASSEHPEIWDATYPRLLRSMGWCDDWNNWEETVSHVENFLNRCVDDSTCVGDSSGGFEYTNAGGVVNKILSERSPNAKDSPYKVPGKDKAGWWNDDNITNNNNNYNNNNDNNDNNKKRKKSKTKKNINKNMTKKEKNENNSNKRLKVGLVSSDFGVHPVSTLIRGVIQFISEEHKKEVELYCFALKRDLSWWGRNVSNTVEHFIHLTSGNTQTAAAEIATHKIEVLIDLNGHTLHSGLPILSHRPAPIQISFLGLPTTTSAAFIDYYIGDYKALPAEMVNHFSEKLILMPGNVIVNDYAQMQGDVLKYKGDYRAPRDRFEAGEKLDELGKLGTILLGTLSNYSKISPAMFQVFMNIIRSVGGSKFLFTKYQGWDAARPNLEAYAPYHGVQADRLAFTKQQPWIEHLYMKTSYDLLLDTITKGGHTTGLDGYWAGVPTITVPGSNMPARAGLAIAETLGEELGVTYSLKEFEDIAIKFSREAKLLKAWRERVEGLRVTSELYDTRLWTRRFVRLLQAAWEAAHIAKDDPREPGIYDIDGNENGHVKYNIFSTTGAFDVGYGKPRTIPIETDQVYIEGGIANFTRVPESPSVATYEERARTQRTNKMNSNTKGKKTTTNYEDNKSNKTKTGQSPSPLPEGFFENNYPVMLNIGGLEAAEGWTVINSQDTFNGQETYVNLIREMYDLHGFHNNSVGCIYASHLLEHASFGDGMLRDTLNEWHRVLHPGGLVMISVPDMQTLAKMYLDPSLTFDQHWMITRMMYGAQMDEYDYHKIGFDESVLTAFLQMHQFCDIERVSSFNLFRDTSDMIYANHPISLNIVARPCAQSKPEIAEDDDLWIDHHGTPYRATQTT